MAGPAEPVEPDIVALEARDYLAEAITDSEFASATSQRYIYTCKMIHVEGYCIT